MWKKIGKILLKILLIFIAITVLMTIVYRWVNPPITPLMVSRAVFDGYPIKKKWIPIEDMPQSLLNCVVASEDNFFLSHYGIDFGAVEKAIEYNKKHKKTRGASTVSQQTAKNVFLWQGRTWVAIIFTESTLTQNYIAKTLKKQGYDGKLILFNGQNNSPESTEIYRQWLMDNKEV